MAEHPCPNCGGSMFIEEMHEGFVVPCPHCADSFRVPRGAARAQKPIHPPTSHLPGSLPAVGSEDPAAPLDDPYLGADPSRRDDRWGAERDAVDVPLEPDFSVDDAPPRRRSAPSPGITDNPITTARAGRFAEPPPPPRIPDPRAHGGLAPGSRHAPQPSTTSGEDIGIFILSLVGIGLCQILSPVAALLGHLRMQQVRREGRQPDGLLKAGWIIGLIGSVMLFLCFVPALLIGALN